MYKNGPRTHFKVGVVEECLEVRDVVEAEVMVSHDHWSAVGHHTPSVSHQHPASGGLHIGLTVLQGIVLRQTPKW